MDDKYSEVCASLNEKSDGFSEKQLNNISKQSGRINFNLVSAYGRNKRKKLKCRQSFKNVKGPLNKSETLKIHAKYQKLTKKRHEGILSSGSCSNDTLSTKCYDYSTESFRNTASPSEAETSFNTFLDTSQIEASLHTLVDSFQDEVFFNSSQMEASFNTSADTSTSQIKASLHTPVNTSQVEATLDASQKENPLISKTSISPLEASTTMVDASHIEMEELPPRVDRNNAPSMAQETHAKLRSYLGAHPNGDSVIVALEPHSKFYVRGYFWLELLFGSASIFGYNLSLKEKLPVYSFETHTIFSVDSRTGDKFENITQEFASINAVPLSWLRDMFKISINDSIVLARVSLFKSDLKNTVSISDAWKLHSNHLNSAFRDMRDSHLWDGHSGVITLSPTIVRSQTLSLFKELPEWRHFSSLLADPQEGFSVIVTGGKGTGKSTFLKYVINCLIGSPNVHEVACIDLDPGQPEFSQPGSLSLSKFSSPALGPPFSHQEGMTFSYFKSVLLGTLSVDKVLSEYLNVCEMFVQEALKFDRKVPIIVNTMGYTAGIGLDIVMDVIRTVRPTHVVTLLGRHFKQNFSKELNPNHVNKSNSGIVTKGHTQRVMFEYIPFSSYEKVGKFSNMNNRQLRDLTILSYFSKLWKGQRLVHSSTCKPAVMVPWNTVALHNHGSYVPFSNILQAINASLVALCHIEESHLQELGKELPKKLKANCSWAAGSECLGWAIVQGIDVEKKEIALLTPMTQEEILASVNTLVLSNLQIPMVLRKLFCSEDSPYWEMKFATRSKNQKFN